MDIWYILMMPFTALLKLFYSVFNSYGVAIILFALAIKIILFPVSLKGKRSMIQMNMLAGEQQKLQKQYGKDQNRYNEELQKLYAREGVSTTGGCLWSMLPLLILFPVYAVVRRPMKYWLGLGQGVIDAVTTAVKDTGVTLSSGYPEIDMVSRFFKDPGLLNTAQSAAHTVDPAANVYGIDLSFLGIDLSATVKWKFWEGGITWGAIGLVLIVVLCAVSSLISSQIMMKTNQMNTQNQQAAQQNKMMMWMSPLMMLWFGTIMPGAMGIYIIANSVFSTVQEIICGKMLKKDYEQAAEKARLRAIEEKEEEKRQRREKAERKAREAEEAKKNKGKKIVEPEDKMTHEQREAAREGIRQYARGRAYDPDRYGGVTPYIDPSPKAADPEEPREDKPREPKEPWEDSTKE